MDDLDRWTRVLPLGAGAFGEVHLAWDHVDSRWVACKRFTGQDELGLLRMVIESRIRVSHPHLVRTLAFRLVDDRAWLVTELARGGSLRALMTRTGALPWGWVVEAVDQVLAALTALHASGVIHRDLKPANLLLRSVGSSPPHLLVGDFGIATWRTVSMTGIGAAIGTPGYLAPEYLDGHAPSPATDLFAVGVLAAEMLTGRRLVHYSNASPSMPSSWRDVLPVPADVPPGLVAVLQRMAAPDQGWRYLDCTQAREALLSAVPPTARGDLTTVEVPDLLAAVPPGWTAEGPEQPTTALPTVEPAREVAPIQEADPRTAAATPDPAGDEPNLVSLPIDGGPTALVLENEATDGPDAPLPATREGASDSSTESPSGSSSDPGTPATGSSTDPASGSPTSLPKWMSGSSTHPPTGSSTSPPTGSATSSTASSNGTATPTTVGPATPPATPPSGSATPPPPQSGSSTQPPSGSATPPTTSTSGSATSPPADSRTPPTTPPQGFAASSATPTTGPSTQPPSGSATPPTTPPRGSAAPPATPTSGPSTQPPVHSATPATPPRGSAATPVTPTSGPSTQPRSGPATSLATPPRGSAVSDRAERKAARRRKVKRKVKQGFLLLVLVALLAGGGTLWWAATHRSVAGRPSAVGGGTSEQASPWVPTIVGPCAAVELDSPRNGKNGPERCQRTPDRDPPQSWVEEPPGGFPKSNAAGPFPNEACNVDGDRNYSPVGDHVQCDGKAWKVIA